MVMVAYQYHKGITSLHNPCLVTSEACASFNPNSLHNVCHLATRSYLLQASSKPMNTRARFHLHQSRMCTSPPYTHTFNARSWLSKYTYYIYQLSGDRSVFNLAREGARL